MNKYLLWMLILLIALTLVGCDQLGIGEGAGKLETPEEDVYETPVYEGGSEETTETLEATDSEAAGEEEASGEAPAQLEFVPISVDDLGVTTVAPAEWPKIEDDPLLKNAWGPGQFRFVAFHSVSGDSVQEAMAQLLSTTAEELEAGTIDGEYWEEEIGDYLWAMYAIENPDVGLVQTVSMSDHEGAIYIVSLFIESVQKDAVLTPVLENFAIEGGVDADVTEAGDSEADEAAVSDEDGTVELIDSQWVLNAYDDGSGQLATVLPDVDVTALFEADGRVAGSAGCNEFVSIYTVEGESLSVSLPAMTRKECVDPPGIMLQETAFLGNLSLAASYRIEGNELQLLDEAGKALLTFLSS